MIYPEWKTKNHKTVINEVCFCGAYRTEHEDNHPVFAQGHGACPAKGCKRFTFKSYVFKPEPKKG